MQKVHIKIYKLTTSTKKVTQHLTFLDHQIKINNRIKIINMSKM